MTRFIGSIDDYEKYIGPRIRNVINTFAKSEREKRQGICEFCGKKAELQSAHKYGKERKKLIYEALKNYNNGSYFDIDVAKCENEILELHKPINQTFYFLCADCHKKYDNNYQNQKSTEQFNNELADSKENYNNFVNIDIKKEYQLNNSGELKFIPDQETFRKNLLKARSAQVTIIYKDGTKAIKTWDAKKFTASSGLINNIRSGHLRGWKEKGILQAIFEVI